MSQGTDVPGGLGRRPDTSLSPGAKASLVVFIAVIVFAVAYGLFVEYRAVYYADNQHYQICQTGILRDCLMLQDDSYHYIQQSRTFDFVGYFQNAITTGGLSPGLLTNLLPYAVFQVALFLSPKNPYIFVILFNGLLFVGGLRNMLAIARKLGVDEVDLTILYCVNPLMVFAMTSLNKEIFGIYLLSLAGRAFLYRRIWALFLTVCLSHMTRLGLGVAVTILAGRYFAPRVKLKHIALMLSLVVPAAFTVMNGNGFSTDTFLQSASMLDQHSSALTGLAGQMLQYPFGPLVAWFLIGSVDLVSPLLNVPLYLQHLQGFDIDIFTLQVSSFLFTLFFSISVYRLIEQKWVICFGAEVFVLYLLVIATFPISQHRYLVASWPFLALALLECRKQLRGAPPGRDLAQMDVKNCATRSAHLT